MFLVLLLTLVTSVLVVIMFLRYCFQIKDPRAYKGNGLLEIISVGLMPLIFLMSMDLTEVNDCCTDSAVFSPQHRLSVYSLIFLCAFCYFYCGFRKTIASPIVEVLLNCVLLLGIALNIVIAIHLEEWGWVFGNLPIILLFILMLMKNHYLYIIRYEQYAHIEKLGTEKFVLKILCLPVFKKAPIFFIICLPVLFFFSAFLLLFGQQPDSLIRAFTDTYKHGFSQLDYQCAGVACEGHYLCTVAAKGHKWFVKPERSGVRGGKRIICNRQLLIANAFEELLEQYLPSIHRGVRRFYDKIGDCVERYYFLFNYKLVCDFVYLIMKPLEWFFLFALYLLDKHPENRIAVQYLNKADRMALAGKRS